MRPARSRAAVHRNLHGDGGLPDTIRSTMIVETGSHSATMLRLSPFSPRYATNAAHPDPWPARLDTVLPLQAPHTERLLHSQTRP